MFDIRKKIAPRLKSCRTAKEWTFQETAARLSEISGQKIIPSRYGNWEMAINTPPLEQLIYLGRLFGRPPGWLAGLTDDDGSELGASRYSIPLCTGVPSKDGLLDLGNDAMALHNDFLDELKLKRENILLVEAPDDSMMGVIEKGDRVLIDLGDKEANRDDLFALLVNGRLWLRWIRQQLDSKYSIQAEIRDRYADQLLTPDELAGLQILGRVRLIAHIR